MNGSDRQHGANTLTVDANLASSHGGLLVKLVLLAVALLLIGQVTLVGFALNGFEQELDSQLYRKANAVGEAMVDQISYAVDDLGIPQDELIGVNQFFGNVLADNVDIEYMAFVDIEGELKFASGIERDVLEHIMVETAGETENFSTSVKGFVDGKFPVQVSGTTIGHVHVGVSNEHIRAQFSAVLHELIIVIAISCLLALEFIVFFMLVYFFEPMSHIETLLTAGAKGVFAKRVIIRARDEVSKVLISFNALLLGLERKYADFAFEVQELGQVQILDNIGKKINAVKHRVDSSYIVSGDVELHSLRARNIRVPLFLFIFAEELSRSFLPLFVLQHVPADAVSQDWLVGLPITLSMLAAMVATPLAGGFTDRFGVRRVFLCGIVVAFVGFVGTFFVQGYADLVAWRVVSGFGYGIIFTTSEAWVAQNALEHNRARSAAVFVGAVFVGIVCGPPIGGILADRIGYEATFLISAGLAVVSGLMVVRFLASVGARESSPATRSNIMLTPRQWKLLFTDLRFIGVLVFAAIPNKMAMAGFLFYLVPLYLTELQHTQSGIGRMMMLYGLACVSCVNLCASLVDRTGRYALAIAGGGMLAGLGFMASIFSDALGGATATTVIGILALGFGHALTFTSQIAIVQEVADSHRHQVGKASVLSCYRLIERSGMVLGPVLVVWLSTSFGYHNAILGIGAVMLVATAAFFALMSMHAKLSEPDDQAEVAS